MIEFQVYCCFVFSLLFTSFSEDFKHICCFLRHLLSPTVIFLQSFFLKVLPIQFKILFSYFSSTQPEVNYISLLCPQLFQVRTHLVTRSVSEVCCVSSKGDIQENWRFFRNMVNWLSVVSPLYVASSILLLVLFGNFNACFASLDLRSCFHLILLFVLFLFACVVFFHLVVFKLYFGIIQSYRKLARILQSSCSLLPSFPYINILHNCCCQN